MNEPKSLNDLQLIPSEMPAMNSRIARAIGRFFMRLSGWRYEGSLPNEKKMMVAAAPHTSNWDFVIAVPIILSLGVKASIMMKKEAFIWPIDKLWRWLGFIPVDRSGARGSVGSVVEHFERSEKLWFVLAPEGTRSKVDKWRTGFLNIAHKADVPVFLVAWDFPSKTVHFGPLLRTTGDVEADLSGIQKHFGQFTGKRPELQ